MLEVMDRIECGSNVGTVTENEECRIMKLHDDSGEGIMTMYNVLPGIMLSYNDFHMRECISEFRSNANLFSIEHCREGRIEQEALNSRVFYQAAGDLRIDRMTHHSGHVTFPLCHYHGISIGFELDTAASELPKLLNGFSVNLFELADKFCSNSDTYLIPGEKAVEHIFSELYTVPSKIKKDYYKIKVLELLLYLDALELPKKKEEKPYFYKAQVEKIKAAQALMTSNITRNYTIDELAQKFDIATTPLKECFKGVYGSPVFSYMKTYRMNYAAALLKCDKSLKITDVAGAVGYDSPSKFAAAFKNEMGKTPLEYKKSFV